MVAPVSPNPPLFLAFASGSISYSCAPCGRCCRGLGMASELSHLHASPELTLLAPFAAPREAGDPLQSLYTFADGCRFLSADNACALHYRSGPAAKPRICRLFPFSRLHEVDGLWVLLPHGSCPWQAAEHPPSPQSLHETVLADLNPLLAQGLTPKSLDVLTPMPANDRLRLETAIRDQLDLMSDVQHALASMDDTQGQLTGAYPPPSDLDVWLDLLRCAGEPPPLSQKNGRLLIAALPALRVSALGAVPLVAAPLLIRGFVLWLRATAELGLRTFTGEDILHLFAHATPLLRLLCCANQPIPELPATLWAPDAPFAEIWRAIGANIGRPLGPALLKLARGDKLGPLSIFAALGRQLPTHLFF